MEDQSEEVMEIFCQDGVLLNSAPASFMGSINTSGTLLVVEYLNSNRTRCIEWKPNDITIDSDDVQDQEWAVVNKVERRSRTLSGSTVCDSIRSKYLKINLNDIKSFKVSTNNQSLQLFDGRSDKLGAFFFQHGNCEFLITVLRGLLHTTAAKRDRNLYIVIGDHDNSQSQQLDRSFAELNLFQDQQPAFVWKFVNNFQRRPYATTMEAFSKISDIVYRYPEQRLLDPELSDILNRSLEAIENNTTTQTHDEYEVIAHVPKLPKRKDFPRGRPLSLEQWKGLQDHEGRIEDVDAVKMVVFRGGISPLLRKKVWKFLLDYYPWDSTKLQQHSITKQHSDEYYVMKLQWRSMTKIQEENFTDYRDRRSIIEKDVNRTDRNVEYFAGENNPNLQVLFDILMSYVMYNFDLGYVQGMSDLLSPILYLFNDEVDAFWCFVGFMNRVSSNFDMDQAGMKEQLEHLHTLLAFIEPELANYLDRHESGNMFFCFRWLLVWFKRELSYEDVLHLWEVLWTGLPCQNFHLLISVAILETEKNTLMENNYGFTEILKHINDLSGNIDISAMISKAEGMYHQIVEARHLTDSVRLILGLPILGNTISSHESSPSSCNDLVDSNSAHCDTLTVGTDEDSFERAINTSYL